MGQVLYEMHKKVLFFRIYWMNIFYVYFSESGIIHVKKNTLNPAKIYPFCVISKFSWYWNKLKNSNELNGCNYEPIYIITWNFSMHYYWLAKLSKYILKQHFQSYPYIGYKLCTQQCERGTINTNFIEEQVSRNLRIGKWFWRQMAISHQRALYATLQHLCYNLNYKNLVKQIQ